MDYRPALRQRTGVGEYVHEVARALVATAPPDESLVLFSASWKDRLAASTVPGAATIDRAIPVSALNFAWHRLGWPPLEWVAGGPVDVAQATHPLLLPSRRAARLVTIYDLDFLDHPERTQREIKRDYPALAGSHARAADQVIVISQHTAREVESRLGVPRSRISICVPGAPSWSRRDGEPRSGGCILFLGTIEPRKNLGRLLDAYERLLVVEPHAPPLVLAGRVTPEAEALVDRTRTAPLAGRVEWTGYVQADQRPALFSRALVFVLPSHTEGFGMPVIEAMTSGVPVIAADRGAIPEAVGGAGILVDPDDAEAMAAALQRVVGDPALRQRMSDDGWQHARQFQWTRTAQGVREAWHLAREHRRAAHG